MSPSHGYGGPVRTVSAIGRAAQRLVSRPVPAPAAAVQALSGVRRPLVGEELGEQRHAGARLDQVDGTTCGSAVLLALATWADPAELERLEVREKDASGMVRGFAARYDDRQREIHRGTNRLWPKALGTTPWGFRRWLARYVPGAGRYRIRFVDDTVPADVDAMIRQVEAALAARRPVPLLVGTLVPRHYCLALRIADDGAWRVYEPTSGTVRALEPDLLRRRALAPVLGFDRLHAVFLPV
ncbi:hypothetical protein GCM10009836_28070 [Pseudonocardia ailaonensis]|uniref:Peptidase C39-like domain-containing protein n=1 Tax=Pseudonocardia ailaonensis TaxID=367279 RepID=A0ABN2N1N3_9PSEU